MFHFLLLLLPNREQTARLYYCDGGAGDLLHCSGLKYVEDPSVLEPCQAKHSDPAAKGTGKQHKAWFTNSKGDKAAWLKHAAALSEMLPSSTTLALMNISAALSAKFHPCWTQFHHFPCLQSFLQKSVYSRSPAHDGDWASSCLNCFRFGNICQSFSSSPPSIYILHYFTVIFRMSVQTLCIFKFPHHTWPCGWYSLICKYSSSKTQARS